MLYRAVRPLLFALDPETAHTISLRSLAWLQRLGLSALIARRLPGCPVKAMGLEFPNPLGLAAGLDKHAEYVDPLGLLGFGFIEIGGVTPRPQPGNPRPRIFRLPQAEAIINRMGFNSVGVERVVQNIRRSRYRGILGANLGKNADTPIERAGDDYAASLAALYPHVHFATINVSSPNTQDLRRLQEAGELDLLLERLNRERAELSKRHGKRVALALKIAPDLGSGELESIARASLKHGMDAVIATNTTTAREGVEGLPHARESGGLSGAPLKIRSTETIRRLAFILQGAIPIIGVGGILGLADAREKLEAGASLLQIYSGLVYRGPSLVREIVSGLAGLRR